MAGEMLNKTRQVTAVFFLIVFVILFYSMPQIYAETDCGFNGVKDRIQRVLNLKKYWDKQINDLNDDIEKCNARIISWYIDIKELKNSEYRKMRIQRAIWDAKGYGGDPEKARQQEIESIREDFKIAREFVQIERDMLKWLNRCLEKAKTERAILR